MRKTIKLLELDCVHCAAKMEERIRKLDGVKYVSVNFMAQKMILDLEEDKYTFILQQAEKIIHALEPDVIIRG